MVESVMSWNPRKYRIYIKCQIFKDVTSHELFHVNQLEQQSLSDRTVRKSSKWNMALLNPKI